jgi:TetR/AcrR family transcriptional repressor of nem operon
MARPKTFERDAALESAKMVFWRQGYSATTTDDLRLAMGIGRQSFYDTFKSKHDTFIEVLDRYNSGRCAKLSDILSQHESPLRALAAIMDDIANEDPETRGRGCIGVSSVCEFGTSDKRVHETNQRAGEVWKKVFIRLLSEAKAAGEIRSSLDEEAAALYLQAMLVGIRVTARGGVKPKYLRNIAAIALEGFKT